MHILMKSGSVVRIYLPLRSFKFPGETVIADYEDDMSSVLLFPPFDVRQLTSMPAWQSLTRYELRTTYQIWDVSEASGITPGLWDEQTHGGETYL